MLLRFARSSVRGLVVGTLLVASVATAQSPSPPRNNLTIDVLDPILFAVLLNTAGSFLEYQAVVNDHFSLYGEVGYLTSSNFRVAGGETTGIGMRMMTMAVAGAWWPLQKPMNGPFISVRIEGWLVTAENAAGTVAAGNVFDANFQPGWQWTWAPWTVTFSLSFAYASGPVRSRDGTVEFPISGFSVTPHLRTGFVW